MSALQPPAVAMWLLTRLAFIGDLVEEYQRRQSRVWFWKQVLVAIGVEAGRDIRAHKLLALRGIVTGFGALSLVSWLLTRVALGVLAKAIPPSWWSYQGGYPRPVELVAAFLMCVAVFSSGWLVARLHRANLAGTLLVYFASFVSYGLVLVVSVPQRLPYHSYAYNLAAWFTVVALYSTCLMLGGLSAARART